MAEGAHVSSIEALEAFKASLIVYISKARPALDEIGAEVLRTRAWLESDRRTHWEAQMRRRAKELETARQELFSATLANLRETTSAEIMAVRKAERAFQETEDRVRVVKRWTRDFDSHMEPLARQLEKLQTTLVNDLPAAIAYLQEVIRILDAYAAVPPPPPPNPAS